ncbi:kinase-like domain-containing protein [Trichophaea hybrida]|nr:kinase-like domain-containing protein [Trichophaea hybrida]
MALLASVDTQRHDIFTAMYGGYAGSGALNMPPPTAGNSIAFWDEQQIQETLTPAFIRRQIPDTLQKRLDKQLKFGEGLTESTYAEWIVERTRKMFIILVEIGAPEKIFDIIDGSWDDDDLPITPENLGPGGLPLGGSALEKKFVKKQRLLMVRDLEPGSHVDYSEDEVVPLEVIHHRLPSSRSQSSVDKVYFPRQRDVYYSRRRIPIGDISTPTNISREMFMEELHAIRSVTHSHIVAVHATYTQEDIGYIILSPAVDQTLKSFITTTPQSFKALSKERRQFLLMDWLHCLSDVVAFLHEEGIAHRDLKPSSIIIDGANRIYLADIGNAKSSELKPAMDVERYEYGAPELWVRKMASHDSSASTSGVTVSGRLRVRRRPSGASSPESTSPTSPVFEKAVHLGTWKNPTTTDRGYWNSDVFSLACIFADILTFYTKRKASSFSSHRSCGSRRPRGSAPPDVSFHANMGQVESWLDQIEKRAKDKHDDTLIASLELVREMFQRDPLLRPSSRRVEKELYKIILAMTDEELPHCTMHTIMGIDAGLGEDGEGFRDTWGDGRSTSSMTEESLGFEDIKPGTFEDRIRKFGRGTRSKRSTGSSGVGGLFSNQWD